MRVKLDSGGITIAVSTVATVAVFVTCVLPGAGTETVVGPGACRGDEAHDEITTAAATTDIQTIALDVKISRPSVSLLRN